MTAREHRLVNNERGQQGEREQRNGGLSAHIHTLGHWPPDNHYYYYYACTWGYMGHMGNHRDRLANLTARESMGCRLLTDT